MTTTPDAPETAELDDREPDTAGEPMTAAASGSTLLRIQLRRDTAAAWTAANSVLAAGEQGLETDTGKSKLGNGGNAWNDLPYEVARADLAAKVNNSTYTAGMAAKQDKATLGADAATALQTPGNALYVAGRAASVSANALALAANPDSLIAGTITRDANGAATAAPVVWPDGDPGNYTATTVSSAFPGAVDAYTITKGNPVTKTYTQAAVTRDATGAVTQRPALAVS